MVDVGGEEGREVAVVAAGQVVVARSGVRSEGRDWRRAVEALSGEPLPGKLRDALVELGAQGRRLRLAVLAYDARVVRAMGDAGERERSVLACRGWPEHEERAAALEAYGDARRVVCAMAVAWVEGPPLPVVPPEVPSSSPGCGELVCGEPGRAFALAVVSELEGAFPGPCSAIVAALSTNSGDVSMRDARLLVRRHLGRPSLRQLSDGLYAQLAQLGVGGGVSS